jgi:hypothetical protein
VSYFLSVPCPPFCLAICLPVCLRHWAIPQTL